MPAPAHLKEGTREGAAARYVGQSVPRGEDAALLCGQGRFTADLDPVPGVLHAAIVRSPYPHARISGFDASAALALRGVAAVIGPSEVRCELAPFPMSLKAPMPYYPAAADRVRYVGEPVGVVVAADRYIAEDAADLVNVQYEPLPAVVDIRTAMVKDAPRLHEEAENNVATDRTFRFGDVDGAFAAAAHIVQGEYDFPRYSSTPMECYVVIAEWSEDDSGPLVTAWSNFHGPFTMAPVIAGALRNAMGFRCLTGCG